MSVHLAGHTNFTIQGYNLTVTDQLTQHHMYEPLTAFAVVE